MISASAAFQAATTDAAVCSESGRLSRVRLQQDLPPGRRAGAGARTRKWSVDHGLGRGAGEVARELDQRRLDLRVHGNALAGRDDVADDVRVAQVAAHGRRQQPRRRRREAGVGIALDRVGPTRYTSSTPAYVGATPRAAARERASPRPGGAARGAGGSSVKVCGVRAQLRGARAGRERAARGRGRGVRRGASGKAKASRRITSSPLSRTGASGGAPPNRNPDG